MTDIGGRCPGSQCRSASVVLTRPVVWYRDYAACSRTAGQLPGGGNDGIFFIFATTARPAVASCPAGGGLKRLGR